MEQCFIKEPSGIGPAYMVGGQLLLNLLFYLANLNTSHNRREEREKEFGFLTVIFLNEKGCFKVQKRMFHKILVGGIDSINKTYSYGRIKLHTLAVLAGS